MKTRSRQVQTLVILWVIPDITLDRYAIYGEIIAHGHDGGFALYSLVTDQPLTLEADLLGNTNVVQYAEEAFSEISLPLVDFIACWRGQRWSPQAVLMEAHLEAISRTELASAAHPRRAA